MKRTEINIWRQKVPLRKEKEAQNRDTETALLLLLSKITLECIELGFEFRTTYSKSITANVDQIKARNFALVKCFIASILVEVCDPEYSIVSRTIDHNNDFEVNPTKTDLVKLFALGESITEENLQKYRHKGPSPSSKEPDFCPGFCMRLETWDSNPLDIAISGEVDRIMIFMNIDAIHEFVNLFIEGLVIQDSATAFNKHPDVSKQNENLIFFPCGSVGAKIETLISKLNETDVVDHETNEVNIVKPKQSNVGCFLVKLNASNLTVIIPEVKEFEEDKSTSWSHFGVIIDRVCISGEYFPSSAKDKSNVVQNCHLWKTQHWNSSEGIHVDFLSHQRLNLFTTEIDGGISNKNTTTLIPAFEVELCANPANAKLGFKDSSVSCTNILLMERFAKVLTLYKNRADTMTNYFKRKSDIISNLSYVGSSPQNPKQNYSNSSIENVRINLKKIVRLVASSEMAMKGAVTETKNSLKNTRTLMFMKERQRIAMLSILSHNCSGWMRLGDKATNGQRTFTTASLSKHWVVLRHSLVIVFPNTHMVCSQMRPYSFLP